MKRSLFKKNTAINQERIERIEMIISRLVYRSGNDTKAIITPFPISNAVVGDDIRGIILRYIFPCKGKITRGCVKLNKKPVARTAISVRIFNDMMSNTDSLIINKKIFMSSTDVVVFPGDCLEVSLVSEDIIKEAWVSMLWTPDGNTVDIKKFLTDELESDFERFTGEELDA